MQLKIQSDLAAQRAKSAGIKTVMDRFPVIKIHDALDQGC
jgi:predicted CoA-binding protein